MTSLVTADIHLDDVPKNQYRWGILPWLESEGNKREVDLIFVVGDVTDAKDRHSSRTVNRLFEFLANSANQWIFVQGNHDFYDPEWPFFGFLDHLENVRWIREPKIMNLPVGKVYTKTLLLPATKEWETVWPPFLDKGKFPYVFLHGTFEGTLSETGYPLPGISKDFFDLDCVGRVYAGDVHVPGAVIPRIESLGSPHRVRFGDSYKPRVVYIGQNSIADLYPNMMMRHVVIVRNPDDLSKYPEVEPGDQVKIRVKIKRSEFPEWVKIRSTIGNAATALGWEVHGIELLELAPARRRLEEPGVESDTSHKTAREYLLDFATAQNLKKSVIDTGLRLLAGT
jgi:3',5'-cyclic AMP phosphodiesterase CpdA